MNWIPFTDRHPTLDDADEFGHVLFLNPSRGSFVDVWHRKNSEFTHWKKTELPDLIGDEFKRWMRENANDIVKSICTTDTNSSFKALELAFRAGAAVR